MLFKEQLYQQCLQAIDANKEKIAKAIAQVVESLSSESKSTAGDKHETGRAMLQLEREKLGQQLQHIEATRNQLLQIDSTKSHTVISIGSYIQTSQLHLFLSVAVGQINVAGISVMAISPQSPLGMALLGNKEGDIIEFRGLTHTILKVS